MAAELLAALAPSVEGTTKDAALRAVDTLKEVLDSEPTLLVQLTRAHGGSLVVKAAKVLICVRSIV